MFANREIILLFAAGALAACLMGTGILIAVDDLVSAGQPVAVRANLASSF